MIIGHGMVAFRDPFGIRPLVLGKREIEGKTEYMFASESVALDVVGFEFVRDVLPGEAIYVTFDGQLHSQICADNPKLNPCILNMFILPVLIPSLMAFLYILHECIWANY